MYTMCPSSRKMSLPQDFTMRLIFRAWPKTCFSEGLLFQDNAEDRIVETPQPQTGRIDANEVKYSPCKDTPPQPGLAKWPGKGMVGLPFWPFSTNSVPLSWHQYPQTLSGQIKMELQSLKIAKENMSLLSIKSFRLLYFWKVIKTILCVKNFLKTFDIVMKAVLCKTKFLLLEMRCLLVLF